MKVLILSSSAAALAAAASMAVPCCFPRRQVYTVRIDQTNRRLNSTRETNPDVLSAGEALDKELSDSGICGPMARSMMDVALLLDIMAGLEQYNIMWNGSGHYPQGGYSAQTTNDGSLNGMKLGLPWNPYWSTELKGCQRTRTVPEVRKNTRPLPAAGAEIANITYNAASRRDHQPVQVRPAGLGARQAQAAERAHGAAGGVVRQIAAELDVPRGWRGGGDEQPRGDEGVEGGAHESQASSATSPGGTTPRSGRTSTTSLSLRAAASATGSGPTSVGAGARAQA
ncbi:hypothetical protein DL768_002374 [Monosporascus sp. mg162]|nr:hypothetical protein DL768_002374 [Monosporascus sp. mg162]